MRIDIIITRIVSTVAETNTTIVGTVSAVGEDNTLTSYTSITTDQYSK